MIELHISDVTKEQPQRLRLAAAFLQAFATLGETGSIDQALSDLIGAPSPQQPLAFNASELSEAATLEKSDAALRKEQNAPDAAAIFGNSPPPPAPAGMGIDVPPASITHVETATYGSTPPPPAVERDSAGLPWDERIHSSNRKKVSDGTWQKRRGVSPQAFAEVTAELLGQPVAGATPPAPPSPPAATVTDNAPPPPPAPPAAPVAPAADNSEAWVALTKRIQRACAETPTAWTLAKTNEWLAQHGLKSTGDLFTRPDLIAQFHADITAAGGAQ